MHFQCSQTADLPILVCKYDPAGVYAVTEKNCQMEVVIMIAYLQRSCPLPCQQSEAPFPLLGPIRRRR